MNVEIFATLPSKPPRKCILSKNCSKDNHDQCTIEHFKKESQRVTKKYNEVYKHQKVHCDVCNKDIIKHGFRAHLGTFKHQLAETKSVKVNPT